MRRRRPLVEESRSRRPCDHVPPPTTVSPGRELKTESRPELVIFLIFQIRLDDTVMLSDSFLINRDRMSCTILDASWTDIHCITRLRDVGLVTGMKLETNDT